jgi:hypothetical protein
VSPPLLSAAKAGREFDRSPAPTPAAPATVNPFWMNERRLAEFVMKLAKSFICSLLFVSDEVKIFGTVLCLDPDVIPEREECL